MRQNLERRGDTLIEVMLAIAVAAAVIVLTVSVMSRGLSSLQLSTERSQVRSHMEGQSAMLRYARDTYMSEKSSGSISSGAAIWWRDKILNDTASGGHMNLGSGGAPASVFHDDSCKPSTGAMPFYIKYDNASSVTLEPYTEVKPDTPPYATPGKQLWIEAYRLAGASVANPSAIDFAIRACWSPPGGGALQHETTILRLYDAK